MTATTDTRVVLDIDETAVELIVEAIGDYVPYAADMAVALGEDAGGHWAQRVETYLRLKERLGGHLDQRILADGGDPR